MTFKTLFYRRFILKILITNKVTAIVKIYNVIVFYTL